MVSDSDFVDIGDKLVVSISGYPVGKAVVESIHPEFVNVILTLNGISVGVALPLNFKDHDKVDGYGHHSQPLEGHE